MRVVFTLSVVAERLAALKPTPPGRRFRGRPSSYFVIPTWISIQAYSKA